MNVSIPWPHVFRRSARARYMRIILKAGQPVEVVYPRWSSKLEAMGFLQEKLAWIAKHEQFIASLTLPAHDNFPDKIVFPCINREWQIQIQQADRPRVSLRESAQQLDFIGPIKSVDDLKTALRQWMKSQAVVYLEPMLRALSVETALPFETVSWRFQRTRWGSCSDQKRLSLNAKLLQLSWPEVRYIMLHELCHTRHMSHGVKFWRLLESYCDDAKEIDQSLYARHISAFSWL